MLTGVFPPMPAAFQLLSGVGHTMSVARRLEGTTEAVESEFPVYGN